MLQDVTHMQSPSYEQLRKEREGALGEVGDEYQVTVRDELLVGTFYWCIFLGSFLHRRFCSSFSPLGALCFPRPGPEPLSRSTLC